MLVSVRRTLDFIFLQETQIFVLGVHCLICGLDDDRATHLFELRQTHELLGVRLLV